MQDAPFLHTHLEVQIGAENIETFTKTVHASERSSRDFSKTQSYHASKLWDFTKYTRKKA
jgi:hypothetical protein